MKRILENQLFKSLIDSTPILIWFTDDAGHFVYYNKTWCDFTSGKLQEIRDRNNHTLYMHHEDATSYLEAYQEHFSIHERFTIEYRLLCNDGNYHWMREEGVPWYDDEGMFHGYIGACYDIAEFKKTSTEERFTSKIISSFFNQQEYDNIEDNGQEYISMSAIEKLETMEHAGELTIVSDLIQIFMESTPNALVELEQAAKNNNRKEMTAIAHPLKSSAATLGALQLRDLFAKIEENGQEGKMDAENLELIQKAKELFVLSGQQLQIISKNKKNNN
ncbi:MAG: PAS domain S-box protein [Oligoflexia bacterium]|nr:PAS domain S-box protein [Oligoflexia bacterium]